MSERVWEHVGHGYQRAVGSDGAGIGSARRDEEGTRRHSGHSADLRGRGGGEGAAVVEVAVVKADARGNGEGR